MALILDFETASTADIKELGTCAYLEHPDTHIVVCAIHDPKAKLTLVWDWEDTRGQNGLVLSRLRTAAANDETVWAHNATGFEIHAYPLFCAATGLPEMKLTQWKCSQALCRRAAIPVALGNAAKFLGLPAEKDTDGKALIRFFHGRGYDWLIHGTEPEPGLTAKGKPKKAKPLQLKLGEGHVSPQEAFKRYGDYCALDTEVTFALIVRLKPFWLTDFEAELFQLDARMNLRGFPVDIEALQHAQTLCAEAEARAREQSEQATDGISVTQRNALLAWLQERGWPRADLRSATITESLENDEMSDEVRQVLEMRAGASWAAIKKIPTMLNVATRGRIRNCFVWSGAMRTHRWSAKLVQPHNFKRPDPSVFTRVVIQHLREKLDADTFELEHGSVLEPIASTIRHFIREPDRPFLQIDFSNIEARLVQWLAGQEDMVQAYRDGRDAYRVMASLIYNIPYDQIAKDSAERTMGKMAVLLCGYQGGPEKFAEAAKIMFGVQMTLDTAEDIVDGYRSSCPAVVRGWKDMNRAALSAMAESSFLSQESRAAIARVNYEPSGSEALDGKVRFETDTAGIEALYMVLPSGHRLCYPRPRLSVKVNTRRPCRECRGWMAENAIADVLKLRKAQDSGKVECQCQKPFATLCVVYKTADKGALIQEAPTYGGKLFENLCQAAAGDCLNYAILNASKAGYEPVMLIHDEAIYPKQPGQSTDELVQIFEQVPPWAKDFPLAADAKEIPYYLK